MNRLFTKRPRLRNLKKTCKFGIFYRKHSPFLQSVLVPEIPDHNLFGSNGTGNTLIISRTKCDGGILAKRWRYTFSLSPPPPPPRDCVRDPPPPTDSSRSALSGVWTPSFALCRSHAVIRLSIDILHMYTSTIRAC